MSEAKKLNEACPCQVRTCPRNRDCAACKAHSHEKGQKTACEQLRESKSAK